MIIQDILFNCRYSKTRSTPDQTIASDASGKEGFGFLDCSSHDFGWRIWSREELENAMRDKEASSTFLEITAIVFAIASLARPRTAIRVICDSAPAVFALERRYCRSSKLAQAYIIGIDN